MKLSWKAGVALVVGSLMLGGVASSVAQDAAEEPPTLAAEEALGHPYRGIHHRGLVRSESVIEREEGVFVTVRVDRGVLQDIAGRTLAIEEADGEQVRVPVSDETSIWKDGEEAELGDLERGDHVQTVREKREDGDYVTRRVIAISAERYEELEEQRAEMGERREACREDADRCPPRLRRMRDRLMRDDAPSTEAPAEEAVSAA